MHVCAWVELDQFHIIDDNSWDTVEKVVSSYHMTDGNGY